jgi:hypothetical protein
LRFDKLCILATGLAACLDATDPPAPETSHSTLRLSTSAGLVPFTPGVSTSFTANLRELVHEPGSRHFNRLEREGDKYRLTVGAASPHAADALALALRHDRLEHASVLDGVVHAVVSQGPGLDLGDFWVDLGPFVQESYDPGRVVLRRRAEGIGPQRIEVLHVASEEEEWRRFLGREVDLVPNISPGMTRYLREVPSVKLVAIGEATAVALYFRVSSGAFQSREARRAVAQRLRRGAVASVAIGDASAAFVNPGAVTGGAVDADAPIRLIFHGGNVQHERAAMVVEQQLLEMGYRVELAALGIEELVKTTATGSFDALLFFGGLGEEQLAQLRTGSPANIPGYANEDYDRHLAEHRFAEARALVLEDVPYTLLYAARAAVAVDARWCNVHPKNPADFTWLADVRPCGPGESE